LEDVLGFNGIGREN